MTASTKTPSLAKASRMLGTALTTKSTKKYQPIGIFTDDGLDQTVYTDKQARKEIKDLKGMGLCVKAIKVTETNGPYTADTFFDILHDRIRDTGGLSKPYVEKQAVLHSIQYAFVKA